MATSTAEMEASTSDVTTASTSSFNDTASSTTTFWNDTSSNETTPAATSAFTNVPIVPGSTTDLSTFTPDLSASTLNSSSPTDLSNSSTQPFTSSMTSQSTEISPMTVPMTTPDNNVNTSQSGQFMTSQSTERLPLSDSTAMTTSSGGLIVTTKGSIAPPSSDDNWMYAGIGLAVGIVLTLLIVAAVYYIWIRRKRRVYKDRHIEDELGVTSAQHSVIPNNHIISTTNNGTPKTTTFGHGGKAAESSPDASPQSTPKTPRSSHTTPKSNHSDRGSLELELGALGSTQSNHGILGTPKLTQFMSKSPNSHDSQSISSQNSADFPAPPDPDEEEGKPLGTNIDFIPAVPEKNFSLRGDSDDETDKDGESHKDGDSQKDGELSNASSMLDLTKNEEVRTVL